MERNFTRRMQLRRPGPNVWLLVICLGACSATAIAAPDLTWGRPSQSALREASLTRIVSTLENRMPNHHLAEKVKAKVLALDDRQVRIAASLAERIAAEEHGAIGETAFLLLTMLIILD
jgi:hypothetical protein